MGYVRKHREKQQLSDWEIRKRHTHRNTDTYIYVCVSLCVCGWVWVLGNFLYFGAFLCALPTVLALS